MKCLTCGGDLESMSVVMMLACFTCSKLFFGRRSSIPIRSISIKRFNDGKWRIGLNPQLTKNQLWEQELERMYEKWITRRILDDT